AYVAGCDLACGLPSASWGPDVAVYGVATDAQDAGPNEFKQGNEIGVRARKQVWSFVKGAFFIRKPGEGRADGASRSCGYGERGSGDGAGGGGLGVGIGRAAARRARARRCGR